MEISNSGFIYGRCFGRKRYLMLPKSSLSTLHRDLKEYAYEIQNRKVEFEVQDMLKSFKVLSYMCMLLRFC